MRTDSGFIILPIELLKQIGFDISTLEQRTLCEMDKTLWFFSVNPGRIGVSFSGILLNGNDALVTELQEVLFGRSLYGRKPFGTVTVFCDDTRIATTVLGPSGDVAVGTWVSDVVRRQV